MRDICWYCGGKLFWQSDFNYGEVYGDGEGTVTFFTLQQLQRRSTV